MDQVEQAFKGKTAYFTEIEFDLKLKDLVNNPHPTQTPLPKKVFKSTSVEVRLRLSFILLCKGGLVYLLNISCIAGELKFIKFQYFDRTTGMVVTMLKPRPLMNDCSMLSYVQMRLAKRLMRNTSTLS